MLLILLSFTACTVVAPTSCHEYTLQYDAMEVSLMTCQMMAQRPLAEWSNVHPGLVITKHHCEMSDTRKSAI